MAEIKRKNTRRTAVTWVSLYAYLFSTLSFGQFDKSVSTMSASSQNVPLSNLRVHVFGAVKNPGTYQIEPSERLLAAVVKAEGLSPSGSERRVELRRGNRLVKSYDLFKLRRLADMNENPYVQNNDVIFVGHKKDVIRIQGPVKEPGDYELLNEKNLKDALEDLGAGFTSGVATDEKISVIRYLNDVKQVFEVPANSEEEMKKFQLANGDVINVPHKFNTTKTFDYSTRDLPFDYISYPSLASDVFVIGGVKMPKPIKYDPRLSIANYMVLAGGKTKLARDDVRIYSLQSKKVIKTDYESDYQVRPGDTLILGEKQLGPDFWITLMTTIAGLAVTSYAVLRR